MIESVFNQEELQKTFLKKGYVILPSILDLTDIAHITVLLSEYKSEYSQSFHTTHFSSDEEYKNKVNQTIIDVVFPKIASYLNAFKPIFGNFMIKKAGADSFLQMHADWTYVDENSFRSISVWIPLIDTTKENGCLGVIEGSHKITNIIRGPGIQQNSFVHDREWIKEYGTLLSIKAGDAIIYDHALLHFSPANMSTDIRPALNLSLVPETAQIIHYCIPEGANEIEKYEVADNGFFIRYANFQRPTEGKLVETLPKNVIVFIDDKMKNYKKSTNFWRKIFSTGIFIKP